MSYRHIQDLAVALDEYESVRSAVAKCLQDRSQSGYGSLVRAERKLETTYVLRLFIEFEGILRVVLLTHDPRQKVSRDAYNRINRAARLFSIPDRIRDSVHRTREYRNSIVHLGGIEVAELTFREARSILNRFLKLLP